MSLSLLPQRFNGLPRPPSIRAWNSRIREAVNQNNPSRALLLYSELKRSGLEPNNLTFPFVAKACAKLASVRHSQTLHAQVIQSRFCSDVFVQTAAVDMYVKCDRLDHGYKVFERMPARDSASWNVILMGFAQSGCFDMVFRLFRDMRTAVLGHDAVTLMALTQAASRVEDLRSMKAVHSLGFRTGLDSDVCLSNTWIAGYAKCGDLESSKLVFHEIHVCVRTLVSWNSMIGACGNFNKSDAAFDYYRLMLREGFSPDISTIISLASSCSLPEALNLGRLVNSHAIRFGCDQDIPVINTFIAMYSKCGDIKSARFLFDSMPNRTHVSWTAMIGGYAENGNMSEALILFRAMEGASEKPDLVTVLSLISGCAQAGSLELGRWIERYAHHHGFKENVLICNALIDMYTKCGSVTDAKELFDTMTERTIVSWTAMISGYALNGEFLKAMSLFDQMVGLDLKPNHVTFLAVLQACTHSGLLEKGQEYFNMMTQDYNCSPGLDHYSCMTDLLGRKGRLREAIELVEKMPFKPDAGVWGALLSACKIHHNIEVGEYVAAKVFELESQVAAPYVELANIYASSGMWDEVARVRSMMRYDRVKKHPGESILRVNGERHAFTVEDRRHSQGEAIFLVSHGLGLLAKDEGYEHDLEGYMAQEL